MKCKLKSDVVADALLRLVQSLLVGSTITQIFQACCEADYDPPLIRHMVKTLYSRVVEKLLSGLHSRRACENERGEVVGWCHSEEMVAERDSPKHCGSGNSDLTYRPKPAVKQSGF